MRLAAVASRMSLIVWAMEVALLRLIRWLWLISWLSASLAHAGTVTVTEPNGGKIPEGWDFATYELANPWDMSDNPDVVLVESIQITGETFAGGIYKGTTAGVDPRFWLLFPGHPSSVTSLSNGDLHPIDTSIYRYLTFKVRYSESGPSRVHGLQLIIFPSSDIFTFGTTIPVEIVSKTGWAIISIDMATIPFTGVQWTSLIRGIRVDPTFHPETLTFEFDWVRLTAHPAIPRPPGTQASEKLVQWSASGTGGSTFSVDAIDSGGTSYQLVSGRPSGTTSYNADFSRLPPGSYTVEVKASDGSSGNGPLTVNQTPTIQFTQPDRAGDVANDYATVVAGNPWGPFDPGDLDPNPVVAAVKSNQLSGISYAGGILSATTTGNDPWIFLNTPQPIDTSTYRMLSYTYRLLGARDIPTGSVARFHWGNFIMPGNLDVSEDVIVEEGLVTYAVGDLNQVPVEGGAAGKWTNRSTLDFFRFDFHEFPTARTVQLHWIRLAPYDSADPVFDFQWEDNDSDNDATISIYRDPDTNPINGNETLIQPGLSEDSADSFLWSAFGTPEGVYNLFAKIEDGQNATFHYATGPIEVIINNNPPDTPSAPSPAHLATGVCAAGPTLSWKGGDPEVGSGQGLVYDVYFGTSSSPPLVSPDQLASSYQRGALSTTTLYRWKIVAKDDLGLTNGGPVWSFTTGGSGCSYSLSSAGAQFGPGSGSGIVGVAAPCGCAWTAVSDDPSWITVDAGSGSGDGIAAYTVAPNTSGSTRTGTLTATGGQVFTVNQDAATNTTSTDANLLFLGEVAEDVLPAGSQIWYKLHLVQGRSYSFSAWAPFQDPSESDVSLAIALFKDNGSNPASVTQLTDVEPLLTTPNHTGGEVTIIPDETGTYRVRVSNSIGTDYLIHVMGIETTLYSPWYFVDSGTGYDGFVEIRNNTSQSIDMTITAYNGGGTSVGSRNLSLPSNGNTVITIGLEFGVAGGFGSVQIAFQGSAGSVSANVTTLSGITGLSFDSPFTPRMSGGSLSN